MIMRISLFQQAVYGVTAQIPQGRVMTYGDVARAAGRPGAARAVGLALHRNPFLGQVPCHRVVRSDGTVGGYVLGNREKCARLRQEGVSIQKQRVNMGAHCMRPSSR